MVKITDNDKPKTLEERVEGDYGRPHYREKEVVEVNGEKFLIAQHEEKGQDAVYSLDGRDHWFGGPHHWIQRAFDMDGNIVVIAHHEEDHPNSLYLIDGNKCNLFGSPHFNYCKMIEVAGKPFLIAQHEGHSKYAVYSSDGRDDWFGGPHVRIGIDDSVPYSKDLFFLLLPYPDYISMVPLIELRGEKQLVAQHEKEGPDSLYSLDGKISRLFGGQHRRIAGTIHIKGDIFLIAKDHDKSDWNLYSSDGFCFPNKKYCESSRYGVRKQYDNTYLVIRDWMHDEKTPIKSISIEIVERIADYSLLDKSSNIFGVDNLSMLNALIPLLDDEKLFAHWLSMVDKYSEGGKNKVNLVELTDIALKTAKPKTKDRFMSALDHNITLTREERNTLAELVECASIDLPHYLVLRKLGEGADGVVYLARHDILGEVKVKIFKTKPLSKIKKAIEQEGVSLEERIRRRIALFDKRVRDKTHITQLYDVGKCKDPKTGEGTFYIVSDYVDAGTIEYKKQDGTYVIRDDITNERIPEIFRRMLLGLKPIHDADMILRDIKLGNTLLSRDHKRLLIDDLETIAELDEVEAGSRLTEGSDRYSAPEVMQDIRNASQQSDLYCAAVCLLYMMRGKNNLMKEINIILDEIAYNQRLNKMLEEEGFNEEQSIFFRKALAFEPDDRYREIIDLAADYMYYFCEGFSIPVKEFGKSILIESGAYMNTLVRLQLDKLTPK